MLQSLIGLTFLLAACPFCFSAEDEKDSSADYKKVDKALVSQILKMAAGEIKEPVAVPWRLFVPPQASADNPLPIVFMLHGAGRRGNDNVGPMDLAYSFWSEEAQKKHPCFVLAPQCRKGTMWVTLNDKHTNQKVTAEPSPELAAAFAALDLVLKTYPVDTKRIYLTGQSMGGFGTWEALYRKPDMWAAAIPICGGGDPSQVEVFKHIPIWAWHGANDAAVPVQNSRDLIDALKKAGANPKYNEPKVGHGSWVPAYGTPELYEWLFSQKRETDQQKVKEREVKRDIAAPSQP